MYVQPCHCSERPPIWLSPAPLPGFQGSVAWYPPPSSSRDAPSSLLDLLGPCLCSWLFSVWHYLQPPPPLTALQDTLRDQPLWAAFPRPPPHPHSGRQASPGSRGPCTHTSVPTLTTSCPFNSLTFLSLLLGGENFKSLLLKIHSFSSKIGFLKDVQKHRNRRMNNQGWMWEEI